MFIKVINVTDKVVTVNKWNKIKITENNYLINLLKLSNMIILKLLKTIKEEVKDDKIISNDEV